MNKEPAVVHCGKCGHEWAICFLPIPAAVFGKLQKGRCPACGSANQLMGELPKATKDGDAVGWLSNGDTGTSSKTIWGVMMGRRVDRADVPCDPADFGRCYRLLKVMPSWRERLPEVAKKYPAWTKLVQAWDELTELYEQELPNGTAPKLYARMQECRA